jgi:hypothetical protein
MDQANELLFTTTTARGDEAAASHQSLAKVDLDSPTKKQPFT